MTYQKTIDYLYASQPAFHLVGAKAYKPGLQNTLHQIGRASCRERVLQGV